MQHNGVQNLLRSGAKQQMSQTLNQARCTPHYVIFAHTKNLKSAIKIFGNQGFQEFC